MNIMLLLFHGVVVCVCEYGRGQMARRSVPREI
jgi:hypothetical protein